MTMPAHPTQTSFGDLPTGQLNLQFVDVSNVWKVKPAARDIKKIRKILIHHHDGAPHDLSIKDKTAKAASGEAMPSKYLDIASRAEYVTFPYGYHYDVPYVEEKTTDGKLVVYIVNKADGNSPHTGTYQNQVGVGISLIGSMRSAEEHTEALSFPSPPAEYTRAPGLPSENQRRVLPVLVRFLQERYRVADCHVQAHFQHGKPTCPGYDTERWVIEHEDASRRAGKACCYPVALEGSGPVFLKKPAEEVSRAAKYVRNTREGKSGFWPFGRRGFWHNGVHLFPKGGAGSPVYAVRDGWVMGARFEKKVVVDGTDYGSAAFVLVQHEEPGFVDMSGKLQDSAKVGRKGPTGWVWGTMAVAVQPEYYSLYLHLKPLDEGLGWVKLLKERDPKALETINKDKTKTASFVEVGLPVKAGDVIGYVGTHDPFAGMDKTVKVADSGIYDDKNHGVLHFEMFSAGNLVKRLEDAAVAKKWTVEDTDENALSEVVAKKLEGVAGMKGPADVLAQRLADMETQDPRNEDPSRIVGAMQDDLLEPLSLVICNHVNEWTADWKSVLDGWYREWGLAKGKKAEDDKRIKKSVAHLLEVIGGFKWGAVLKDYRDRALAIDEAHPHYYHPIRFLNWINGLERVADVPGLPYNTTAGVTAFDVAPRNITVQARADDTSAKITISKNTGKPAISDPHKLVGTRVAVRPSRDYHTVTAVEEHKDGLELTISPPFGPEVKKGSSLRMGGNGWRWVANFKWETSLVGPEGTIATPTTPTPAKGSKR